MKKNFLPSLLAHRGISSLAPENTIIAFNKAKEMGIKWLEFDVMLTKDNIPIVFHDESLKRTTNGKGKIADHTFKELKKLDAGRKFSSQFVGEPIPCFKETLNFLKQNRLFAVVEIKPTQGKDTLTVEKVVHLVECLWPEGLNHIIFSSFSLASLIMVRQLLPKQAIGLGLHRWDTSCFELIKALCCTTIHVNHLILTRDRVKLLKKSGCHILAYTVNNPRRAFKLKQWGIDGFFSDCPHKLF